MTTQVTIHIHEGGFNCDVITDIEITQHMMSRIEKNIQAIINRSITHDMRGRISSINLSMAMLERHVPTEGQQRLQMLKKQVEDLSHIIEDM